MESRLSKDYNRCGRVHEWVLYKSVPVLQVAFEVLLAECGVTAVVAGEGWCFAALVALVVVQGAGVSVLFWAGFATVGLGA